jgi:hypothetical protein
MSLGGEHETDTLARFDPIERDPRGLDPHAKEQEPVDLGKHQIRREKRDAFEEGLPKECVSLCMMLVARTEERDPRTAIGEDVGGFWRS